MLDSILIIASAIDLFVQYSINILLGQCYLMILAGSSGVDVSLLFIQTKRQKTIRNCRELI